MNVKVNINDKEYNSIEEMPPDIRAAFEKAMASPSNQINISSQQTKIVFNGIEYKNIEEMPQDIRQLYEKVITAAKENDVHSGISLSGNFSSTGKISKTISGMENTKAPIKAESIISPRILITGIAVIALIVFLYLMFQGK
ncbi:MAG: hypothetical protein PHV82_16030 [Victivallaceae bacterium]|nr:hypothetical protein [Victivallaceae bacterium]